jgi:hypothetical protein
VKRTRSGTRRRTYGSALLVLERQAAGFTGEDLALVADEATAAAHAVVVEAVRVLRAEGEALPGFRIRNGALTAGALTYRHRRTRHADAPKGLAWRGTPITARRIDEVAAALHAANR